MTSNHISRTGARSRWTSTNARTSLIRRSEKAGAKQISFHRNGDRLCQGVKLAVSSERYKTFDRLLSELSMKLDLQGGAVRYIFNSHDGGAITDVSELQLGIPYVCSTTNSFVPLKSGYGRLKHSWVASPTASKWKENPGQLKSTIPVPTPKSPRQIRSAFLRDRSQENKTDAPRPKTAKEVRIKPSEIEESVDVEPGRAGTAPGSSSADNLKGKLITVIKNSRPPHPRVGFVLNKKTALSLQHVLDQLSALGTLGKVKKLCTVDGTLVKGINELYEENTHFIALSAHEKLPDHGLQWV